MGQQHLKVIQSTQQITIITLMQVVYFEFVMH